MRPLFWRSHTSVRSTSSSIRPPTKGWLSCPTSSHCRESWSVVAPVAAGGETVRRLYHLPAGPTPPAARGERLAIQRVRTSRGVVDLHGALDGDLGTASILSAPQHAGEWIELDLGASRAVSGLVYGFGEDASGMPHHLAIEVSHDGVAWESVWQGRGLQYALAAVMRDPRSGGMSIGFEPRPARYLRLRLLTDAEAQWRIAEIVVTGQP